MNTAEDITQTTSRHSNMYYFGATERLEQDAFSYCPCFVDYAEVASALRLKVLDLSFSNLLDVQTFWLMKISMSQRENVPISEVVKREFYPDKGYNWCLKNEDVEKMNVFYWWSEQELEQ